MSGVGDCMQTIVDANASNKTKFKVFVIVGSVNREVLLWLIASRVRKSECEIMMEQKNWERCISLIYPPFKCFNQSLTLFPIEVFGFNDC
jgi:hypothetical protein